MSVLPLSPVDHVFTGPNSYPICFSIAYDHMLDPRRLRRSLETALQDFWPLRSKLTRISSHSYGVDFRVTRSEMEAQIVRGVLDASGIGTHLSPNPAALNLLHFEPVRVRVPRDQFFAAKRALVVDSGKR